MIIKAISSYAFHDELTSSDSRKDQFTYNARQALFEYLDNLSDETETPMELDIVSICCDYTEYESAIEAVDAYTQDCPYLLDEDELIESDGTSIDTVTLMEKQNEKALDYLNDNTQVIEFDGGIIIQNF
jgi:hypothetical protein